MCWSTTRSARRRRSSPVTTDAPVLGSALPAVVTAEAAPEAEPAVSAQVGRRVVRACERRRRAAGDAAGACVYRALTKLRAIRHLSAVKRSVKVLIGEASDRTGFHGSPKWLPARWGSRRSASACNPMQRRNDETRRWSQWGRDFSIYFGPAQLRRRPTRRQRAHFLLAAYALTCLAWRLRRCGAVRLW
jgi:hypothetical protein